MKYVAPVAEFVSVEAVNILLTSGEVIGCTGDCPLESTSTPED